MSPAEPAGPAAAAPAPDGLQILPVRGLPDFRPGDDLAGAIRSAAGWVQDGDVLVVTSKVVSKVEGRLVASPTDPEQRDAFRRQLIDEQTVRLVAQIGRTKIVENHLGIVAAAAGIDASNVHLDEIALLPLDPDATAAALVRTFADAGVRIGVVITDTQGRAWRMGVTDVAIGAAGIPTTDDHRGGVDEHGNELVVTVVALGDEIAAAADLVKGKLSGVPVAVVRGLAAPGASAGSVWHTGGGQALIRPADEDLFRIGTDLAIQAGRELGAIDALSERRAEGVRSMERIAQFRTAQWAAQQVYERVGGAIIGQFSIIVRTEDATGRVLVLIRDGDAPETDAAETDAAQRDAPEGDQPTDSTAASAGAGRVTLPAIARAGIVLQAVRGFLAVDGIACRWLTPGALEPRSALLALELD